MLSVADIAAGGVGGVAAEQFNKFIESVRGEEATRTKHFHGIIEEQRDYLRIIANALSPTLTPPENDTVQLHAYPKSWPVPEYHRPHLCLFLPSGAAGGMGAYTPNISQAILYLEIPAVGTIIKTIRPGWSQLDIPPQTLISTADGNDYTVIYSFRDDPIQDFYEQLMGSAVTPAASNPTQTAAAGADTSFAWNEPVNHVSLQNNTSANVFYAFDQSSVTAGDAIYVLAAGQSAAWDRKCTVLHLSSANQQNLGGQAGITVEGFV